MIDTIERPVETIPDIWDQIEMIPDEPVPDEPVPVAPEPMFHMLLADAIERGMELHPTWKQAHGVYFREGRHGGYVLNERTSGACAMGFAIAGGWGSGGDGSPPIFPGDQALVSRVIDANDNRRWTLKKIISFLRLGGKE
jgi:hypothetical protein